MLLKGQEVWPTQLAAALCLVAWYFLGSGHLSDRTPARRITRRYTSWYLMCGQPLRNVTGYVVLGYCSNKSDASGAMQVMQVMRAWNRWGYRWTQPGPRWTCRTIKSQVLWQYLTWEMLCLQPRLGDTTRCHCGHFLDPKKYLAVQRYMQSGKICRKARGNPWVFVRGDGISPSWSLGCERVGPLYDIFIDWYAYEIVWICL